MAHKIIGIDVGLNSTGYAILSQGKLQNFGTITPEKDLSFPDKLSYIYKKIKKITKEHSPEIASLETLFYDRHPKSFIKIAQVRGVIALALNESGVKISEFTPSEIKRAITGNGRATKDQVNYMLGHILESEIPKNIHVSDAIACAVCYSLRSHEIL